MGSNKPATKTETHVKNPWAPATQNLTSILDQSYDVANDADRWKPNYSDATASGIQGLLSVANQPSMQNEYLQGVIGGSGAGFGTGLNQLQRTAQGGYVNANPYMARALQPAIADTVDAVNGQFTAGGRYGSPAHTDTLTRGVGDILSKAAMQNYQTERSAQDNAARTLYGGGYQGAGLTNALEQSQIRPELLKLQAGGLLDQQDAARRQSDMQRLQWLSGITNPIAALGSDGKSTSVTTQPVNKLSQGLGIAQMGLGLLGAPLTGGMSLMGLAGAGMGALGGMFGGGGEVNGWANNDPGGHSYATYGNY